MSAPRSSGLLPERIGLREVFVLAWPVMVSMLSRTAMTTADTLFVGRLGTGPLAAIGLAGVASFFGIAIGMGLLGGVNVAVAHRTGSGDHDGVRAFWWQSMWLALGMGVLVAATFWVGPWVFPVLGAESTATVELASSYFSIRVLGAPLAFGNFALTAWLQGRGDTRTPMVATVLANLLNIALDPLFIFGWGPVPAMGVAGAALTTNLALAVGLAVLVAATWREAGARVWPRRDLLAEVGKLGGPLAAWFGLDVFGFALFVSVLARAGEAELAAHVVVVRIMSVSFLPGHAIGEASGVLVGQSLGGGRPTLARQSWRSAAVLGAGFMTAFAVVFLLFPEALLGVFDVEADVVEIGVRLMFIGALFQILDALAMTSLGSLKGAGDTRFTMALGVATGWLIKLPLGAGLALFAGMGAAGAWLGMTVEMAVLAAFGIWRIESGGWLRPWRRETKVKRRQERLAAAAK
jgi:MATE family multidrug resistance protein